MYVSDCSYKFALAFIFPMADHRSPIGRDLIWLLAIAHCRVCEDILGQPDNGAAMEGEAVLAQAGKCKSGLEHHVIEASDTFASIHALSRSRIVGEKNLLVPRVR